MLRTDDAFLIGHNLDSSREVPGTIVINKRNVEKTGVSLYELVVGLKPPNPAIAWTSRYGSVTFNAWGKEFIDGGINEAGLYIHEMTLLGTAFPGDDERPRMFMMQWMQYQLDNYASVEEVLSNLSRIVLDGWTWHFFASDRGGNTAAIEFVDGEPNVYTGDSMPIPVLCNTAYPEELENLEDYAGFGGEKRVRRRDKRTARFVHAAHMIQTAPHSADSDYGFEILKTLERGLTQWSIVIDVNQGRVYFRTSVGRKMRYFDMTRFDFSSDTPAKMLDINANLKGDVFDDFVDYSPEFNWQAAREGIESTDSYERGLSKSLAPLGYNLDDLIDRACAVANGGTCGSSPATARTTGGADATAEDAVSKWIWLPLGALLAILVSAPFLLLHRNRRRSPEGTVC
jgi:choloylglycine hydrolase